MELANQLTTDQKGALAEAKVAAAALELGIGISKPIAPLAYDLVFDVGGELVRVQCKWVLTRGDTIELRCRRCRRGRDGLIHRSYEPGTVDAFAGYCRRLDRCFLVPADVVGARVSVQLRVAPTRNNQHRLVNWADDFAFDATLTRVWGRSSAGRAPEWHSGGQGFEPPRLHCLDFQGNLDA
jgi:PD-(D/E)XK nuclease superfamily protein